MSLSSEARVAVLENRMKNIEDKVTDIDKKLDAGFEKLERLFLEGLNGKADKWAETALSWAAYIVVGAVVAGLLALLGLKLL